MDRQLVNSFRGVVVECAWIEAPSEASALSGNLSFAKLFTKPVLPALKRFSQARRRFTMAMLMNDFPNAPEPTPG